MVRHPLFMLYGLALIGFAGYANFSGLTFSKPTEVRGVPKSIRDNPGSSRSSYVGGRSYTGAK